MKADIKHHNHTDVVKPTEMYCQFLKRSATNETGRHSASRLLGIVRSCNKPKDGVDASFDSHPAMPTKCDCCSYVFIDSDDKGVFYLQLFKSKKLGNLVTKNGAKGE